MKRLLGHPPLLVACAALALAGCGGDHEESATSAVTGERSATAEAAPAEAATPDGRQGDGGQPDRRKAGGEPAGPARQDTRLGSPEPGAKAVAPGVPTQPAGDNSVQTFGTEGEVEAREQALGTLTDFLNARAAGRWGEACAATSRQFKQELAAAAEALPEERRPKGCEAALEYFFRWIPAAARRSSSEVRELLSFRVRGRYAYIIFKGAEDKVSFIAMRNDDGVWKINTPNPEPFPSSGS